MKQRTRKRRTETFAFEISLDDERTYSVAGTIDPDGEVEITGLTLTDDENGDPVGPFDLDGGEFDRLQDEATAIAKVHLAFQEQPTKYDDY